MTPTPTAGSVSVSVSVNVSVKILQAIIIGSCIISGSHGWLLTSSSSSSSSSPSLLVQSTTPTTRCSTSNSNRISTIASTTTSTRSLTAIEMTSDAAAAAAEVPDVAETETEEAPFATIIGNGRIGNALAKAGNCIVLGRNDQIDTNGHGPILIATRNDSLDSIIDGCPTNRRKDLVFLQNGYLDSFLESKGLSPQDTTQVLLYLSVASYGITPTDGITSYNPEGLTSSCGIHAENFARRLSTLQLKCNVCTSFEKEYTPAMYEKLIWISTYMLVGAANGCESVGDASQKHKKQIETIINELVLAVSEKENITFPSGTINRLESYTEVVANFPCGVKEFEWRNKYFWDLGDDSVPTHNNLLKECATKGILPFDLPSSK